MSRHVESFQPAHIERRGAGGFVDLRAHMRSEHGASLAVSVFYRPRPNRSLWDGGYLFALHAELHGEPNHLAQYESGRS